MDEVGTARANFFIAEVGAAAALAWVLLIEILR